ncbi:TcpQ domain-containing protein [Yersinia mollaretii]|uniref:TcpQ domain-containing protein n=1 Tax=Yersinia mollaretii TaxID=33060 RepID=UPI0025AB5384|nr:TcpQ domain-containing protein [Yersinia mollaretii]MDN0112733.1 TcpQ domain-containing protein [Yersinia mollaretii]
MKIIHTTMLIPVLLGGCSLPHNRSTDSDAQQFVDTQISTNLQLIELAQKSLKQASAMTQRSRSPTSSSAVPLNSGQGNPSSIRGLKNVKSLGTPGAFTFVKRTVHNQSIDAVLRQIIPQGWSIDYSADLKGISQQRIDFEANDQWPFVLDRLLIQHQLVALIDWPTQRVSLAHWTTAFNPAPVAISSPAKADNKSTPTKSSLSVPPVTTSGPRNPFSASRRATESTKAPGSKITTQSLSAMPVSSITPIIKPVTVVKPLIKSVVRPQVWRVDAGSTLKDTLFNWAASEKCSVPGISNWTIAWLTSVNYRIDAPLQFEGNFRDALNSLFTLYGTAKVPLYAGIRQAQCVISVDEKEVR